MNYKLIIFDLDGTLYNNNDLIEEMYQYSASYLSEQLAISLEQANQILAENNVYPYVCENAGSTSGTFLKYGLDLNHWNDYRNAKFPYWQIKKENSVNQETLLSFKKFCPIVLLTNNTEYNINNILKQLQISNDTFNQIVRNKQVHGFSKIDTMQALIEEYHLEGKDCLSIGDRYNVDALPMLQLGGSAVVLTDPKNFNFVLKDFPQFTTNSYYQFYNHPKEK